MPKQKVEIDFSRKNTELYAAKFSNHGASENWPPMQGTTIYMQFALANIISQEVRDILKPQLFAFGETVASHIISNAIHALACSQAPVETPVFHYEIVSNAVFRQMEDMVPGLLGEEDPSAWSFIDDSV